MITIINQQREQEQARQRQRQRHWLKHSREYRDWLDQRRAERAQRNLDDSPANADAPCF